MNIITGWWFGRFFIFPYIGNNHPDWLIFFRGLKPPTRLSYMISSIKLTFSLFIVPATVWHIFSESQDAQTQDGSKRQPSQHDWFNRSRASIAVPRKTRTWELIRHFFYVSLRVSLQIPFVQDILIPAKDSSPLSGPLGVHQNHFLRQPMCLQLQRYAITGSWFWEREHFVDGWNCRFLLL